MMQNNKTSAEKNMCRKKKAMMQNSKTSAKQNNKILQNSKTSAEQNSNDAEQQNQCRKKQQ